MRRTLGQPELDASGIFSHPGKITLISFRMQSSDAFYLCAALQLCTSQEIPSDSSSRDVPSVIPGDVSATTSALFPSRKEEYLGQQAQASLLCSAAPAFADPSSDVGRPGSLALPPQALFDGSALQVGPDGSLGCSEYCTPASSMPSIHM